MKPEIFKSDIGFKVGGIPVSFTVFHNLKNHFGVSIEAAIENWAVRTREYTAKSFCKYVMSKDPAFVCMTEKQWKRLNEVEK